MFKIENSTQLIQKLSLVGLALCVVDVDAVLDEPLTLWSGLNLGLIAGYFCFFLVKLRQS